jgi:EAL domain-containing protein (putative c-di-GMP-specific phosphodiesterase class I)/GGDEF domain-containing protein
MLQMQSRHKTTLHDTTIDTLSHSACKSGGITMNALELSGALASSNHEQERLHAVRSTGLLDTSPSESFDRITRLAVELFKVPIAVIALVDVDRLWLKACIGFDVQQAPRQRAFSDYVIRQAEVMVIEDATQDPRFFQNRLVTGEPGIRFYAGAPLILATGQALGSLCIIDRVVRTLNVAEREQLMDLAAIVMSQINLQRAAGRVDEATHLPNHAQMLEDLADLARRCPGQPRTLVLIEAMDHGAIRDAVRAVGISPIENLLRDLSVKIQDQLLRKKLKLYFIGVGRFALVLEQRGDDVEQLIGDLGRLLKEPVASRELLIELDASIGVVPLTLEPEEIREALRKAMTAVHQARILGRPRVTYEPEFDAGHQRAYAILRDVSRAIAQNELHLVYQPKLRVSTGLFKSVEALLRWKHPRLGNIPPGVFIPLTENTTLIHDLTRWVIDAALRQLVEFQALGLFISVAVNVSARNLEQPQFVDAIKSALVKHGVRPEMLYIECTEYSGLTDPSTMQALHQMKAMGIQLSLDDFGIGYSNLACLKSLPFQTLKIDQSLVAPVATDQRAHQLLHGVVELGHGMGFQLLAEGVETAETFEQVIDMGFDHVQGYYLSRPLSPEALVDFLRTPPIFDKRA